MPHCADQGFLIEQVAGSLPHGWELVTKEHPMAIGRTSASLLKRLTSVRNVRVVPPTYNSHVLIERSSAVVVISSTVGLEALLYDKPVLTLGQPFYSGLGITIDLDSFAEIRTAVPQIIAFRPDHDRIRQFLWAANERCFPGVPVLVDRGDGNAVTLAQSVEQAAREALLGRLHSGSSGRTGAPDRAATARSA